MPDDGTQTRRSAHKRLYEARERTAYLEVLSRMQSAIANEYSLDDTLAAVTESAVSLLDAPHAGVEVGEQFEGVIPEDTVALLLW